MTDLLADAGTVYGIGLCVVAVTLAPWGLWKAANLPPADTMEAMARQDRLRREATPEQQPEVRSDAA